MHSIQVGTSRSSPCPKQSTRGSLFVCMPSEDSSCPPCHFATTQAGYPPCRCTSSRTVPAGHDVARNIQIGQESPGSLCMNHWSRQQQQFRDRCSHEYAAVSSGAVKLETIVRMTRLHPCLESFPCEPHQSFICQLVETNSAVVWFALQDLVDVPSAITPESTARSRSPASTNIFPMLDMKLHMV